MTGRRRGVALTPMETRRDVILRTAELADELGYEVFSVAEGWALDATLVLAEIAARTRRIKLAAGIISVWGRSPGTIAMSAATLHQISGGRFVLGLGASTKQLAEGLHDTPYLDPAGRLRRMIVSVRALLSGDRPSLHEARAARPLRLGQPPVPDLPVWVAATGPRTTSVAAELADGWYPIYLQPDRCQARAAELGAARVAAGLRSQPLTVASGPFTVVDEDPRTARRVAAGCMAWYLTAMGEVYPRLLAEQGFADEVAAVAAGNVHRDPRAGTVPDEAQILLDQFTAYGPAATVREQLERWDCAVDIVMAGLPAGLPWPTIEATLRAAAPSASSYRGFVG